MYVCIYVFMYVCMYVFIYCVCLYTKTSDFPTDFTSGELVLTSDQRDSDPSFVEWFMCLP